MATVGKAKNRGNPHKIRNLPFALSYAGRSSFRVIR